MPSFCIVLHSYFQSCARRLVPMPAKALNELSEQPQKPKTKTSNDDTRSTSILVFISAHAIGSLGFAMSIFAIWLGWILPVNATPLIAPEEQVAKKPRPTAKPARRPPAIDLPPLPFRHASEPVYVTPILNSQLEDQSANPRRVYFEDSSLPPIIRRNTMPEPQSSQYLENPPMRSASATATPLSLSPLATIVDLPAEDLPEDINIRDSDNSPHSSKPSSLKSSSCLQKLKLFGHSKNGSSHRSDLMEKLSDQGSIASTDSTNNSEKSARRASGGLTAVWNLSRHRGSLTEVTDSNSASPSRLSFGRRNSPSRAVTRPVSATPTASTNAPSDLLSPSFLSRKSQKRVSAPIPRTAPYGAPYFAAPPGLSDNNYHTYLKTLPQFEDEVQTAIPQTTRKDEPQRGRTSSVRRVNLNILKTKPRSASADGTTGRRDANS